MKVEAKYKDERKTAEYEDIHKMVFSGQAILLYKFKDKKEYISAILPTEIYEYIRESK